MQYDRCPSEKGKCGHRRAQREEDVNRPRGKDAT